jgi:hypothetical protein
MTAATVAVIIEGLSVLAPYLAELGQLAARIQAGDIPGEADLLRAEAARRAAFAALRRQLAAGADPGSGSDPGSG